MDKFKSKATERLGNTKSHGRHETHPDVLAQKSLAQGQFASRVLDEFFTEAYGEVLVDYFMQWLKTSPHEVKTREFLYAAAMGLGSVHEKLRVMENKGKNVPVLKEMDLDNKEDEL